MEFSSALDQDVNVHIDILESLSEGNWDKDSYKYNQSPQTDGQLERTIQTLKIMLRACVLDWEGC